MEYTDAISSAYRGLRDAARRNVERADWGAIGAICESSHWLALRMKNAITATTLPVVELGAGFGSVTAVLPDTTISIERDEKRFAYLKAAFPERTILESCAVRFLGQLTAPTVVVSSIPSVNNSEFDGLRSAIARAYRAGMVAELVTYTYFPHNPFAGIFANNRLAGFELLNVPPAFVWRYS